MSEIIPAQRRILNPRHTEASPLLETAAPLDMFRSLADDELVNDSEIAQAAADPRFGQLMPAVNHIGALAWLAKQGIVSEEELQRRGTAFSARMLGMLKNTDPHAGMRVLTPVDFALVVLDGVRARPAFDVLMNEGLINQAECVLAVLNCTDGHEEFPTPGSALAWMIINRFITVEREEAMFAQEKMATPTRAAALAEARQTLAAIMKDAERAGLIAAFVACVFVFALVGTVFWIFL